MADTLNRYAGHLGMYEVVVKAADHDKAITAKDARIAELETLLKMAWPMLNGATQDFHDCIAATLSNHSEEALDMVQAALSPENQRITPVEPLLAPEHPMAATPSEDGPEVVGHLLLGGVFDVNEFEDNDVQLDMKIVERLQSELVSDIDVVSVPLMTVAQHSRIVAAKDAEIARLNHALAVKEEFYQDALHSHIVLAKQRDELRAQLDAQPARQVGGNEREAVLQIFADNAECSEKGDEGGYVIVHDHHALTIADKLRAMFAQNVMTKGEGHE